MKNLLPLALFALVYGGGCYDTKNPPDYPEPAPMPLGADAGGTPAQRACNRMRQLHCPESDPTPKGETCESVIEATEKSGIVSANPSCLERIMSCAGIKSCAK